MFKPRFAFGRLLPAIAFLFLVSDVSAVDIERVRVNDAKTKVQVVVDLKGPVEHRMFTLKSPTRVVIDMDEADLPKNLKLPKGVSGVSAYRIAKQDDGSTRLVIELSRNMPAKSYTMGPSSGKGHRLVIDLKKTVTRTWEKPAGPAPLRDIIVALDAGHGGSDPGAVGPGRRLEKTVTLAITKKLGAMIDNTPGFKTVLIREGDWYVKLWHRREAARRANADLFVSIHADAFDKPSARGVSVYTVTYKAATSAMARHLAKKANQGLVGGVTLTDKDAELAGILTEMSMDASVRAARDVARDILNEMGKIAKVHSRKVEAAPFAVLKSPDMPSVLVETGFISNPTESRLLASSAYQKKMARAIYRGIMTHFQGSPPQGSYVYAARRGQLPISEHVVKPGDTLSEIAERHQVSMAELQRVNKLKGGTIRVGQTLKLPIAGSLHVAAEPERPKAPPAPAKPRRPPQPPAPEIVVISHKVVSGDTLSELAQDHKTTVKKIMRANNMRTQRLKIGMTLKIPTNKPVVKAKPVVVKKKAVPVAEVVKKAEPDPATHTVVSGDTLSEIALKYKTTVKELEQANKISSKRLRIGQVIRIPEKQAPKKKVVEVKPQEPVEHVTVYTRYKVRSGDNLSEIAYRFSVKESAIKKANDMKKSTLRIGQILDIPRNSAKPEAIHKVRSGDTLSEIADQYGVTSKAIMRRNGLKKPLIRMGQKLVIPQG